MPFEPDPLTPEEVAWVRQRVRASQALLEPAEWEVFGGDWRAPRTESANLVRMQPAGAVRSFFRACAAWLSRSGRGGR